MNNARYLISIMLAFCAPYAIAGPHSPKTLRLGAVLPLSGDLAYYGTEIRNGITLAVENSKAAVELVFEDAPLTGAGALTALHRLITEKQVHGIAGNFSNVAMLSMSTLLNKHHIPTFHTAAIDDEILHSSSWVFTTNVRIRDEGRQLADHLFTNLGKRRAAVLSVQTNFGQGYRLAFEERFHSLGGEILTSEEHGTASVDMKPQIVRLLSRSPDVLFVASFGPFLGTAIKQIREQGSHLPIFSVYESEDESVLRAAGPAALEGLRYFVSYPENPNFSQTYDRRFGNLPSSFARNAFDATHRGSGRMHARTKLHTREITQDTKLHRRKWAVQHRGGWGC